MEESLRPNANSEISELRQEMREGFEEVLETLGSFATHVDGEISGLKQDVGSLKQDVGGLKEEVSSIKQDVGSIKEEVGSITEEVGSLKQDVGGFKEEIGGITEEVGNLKQDFGSLKHDVGVIKATMVTKDYLDDKLFKAMGDMGLGLRKEDIKVDALTGLLAEKVVLTKAESKKIILMGPFSKAG